MKRKTRTQIIKERRYEIIKQLYGEGFLLEEIAKILHRTTGRISQILKGRR